MSASVRVMSRMGYPLTIYIGPVALRPAGRLNRRVGNAIELFVALSTLMPDPEVCRGTRALTVRVRCAGCQWITIGTVLLGLSDEALESTCERIWRRVKRLRPELLDVSEAPF
jgi:hypothetical protein